MVLELFWGYKLFWELISLYNNPFRALYLEHKLISSFKPWTNFNLIFFTRKNLADVQEFKKNHSNHSRRRAHSLRVSINY